MDTYRTRMIAEKEELDVRISKLTNFIGSGSYHALERHDQYLLRRQLLVMNEYSEILNQRLERL